MASGAKMLGPDGQMVNPDGRLDPSERVDLMTTWLTEYLEEEQEGSEGEGSRAHLEEQEGSEGGGNSSSRAYTIRFLTSEAGLRLNDRVCDVIGHNGQRLEVCLRDDSSEVRVKMCNLLPLGAYHGPSATPLMADQEVCRRLRAVLQRPTFRLTPSRPDMKARIEFVRARLAAGVPPLTRCGELMISAGVEEGSDLMWVMRNQIKCCNGHDGMVDFRRFNNGLVGDGQECAVCLKVLQTHKPATGFPCGHVFHEQCAAQWLARNNTCPTCRFKMGLPGPAYRDFHQCEQRIMERLNQWFISGQCERCQAVHVESDPMVSWPDEATGQNRLIPFSEVAKMNPDAWRAQLDRGGS